MCTCAWFVRIFACGESEEMGPMLIIMLVWYKRLFPM